MPDESVEKRNCRQCGEAFVARTLTLAGRPLYDPRDCLPCSRSQPVVVEGEPDTDHRILRRMADVGVNVRKHGHCTLENWISDDDRPRDACRGFVEDVRSAGRFEAVQSLYLCGTNGTGKTHLAVGTIRALLEADPSTPVIFDRAERLMTDVRDTYGTGKTGRTLDRRERTLVWVMDDLGAENAASDVLRIITDLMSAREGWPTVVTSNYRPDELVNRFRASTTDWERLVSRLASQNFRAVAVKGEDHRFTGRSA